MPDWNLEDITSNPDIFLQRLEFRVEADLHRQLFEGANGGPGDREIVQPRAEQRTSARKDDWASFMTVDKNYGRYLEPNGPEGRRSLEDMAVRSGLLVPANEAELLIPRQANTLRFYNDLIEEILGLGSQTRIEKIPTKKSTPATASTMASLRIDPKPMKASLPEVIAQAVEQKIALEDWLSVLRSEAVVLNQAVNIMFFSRPELVPDDRGRVLPLMTDKYLSSTFFEVMKEAVKGIVVWDYIIRLLRLLEGLDDKVKRPIVMQVRTGWQTYPPISVDAGKVARCGTYLQLTLLFLHDVGELENLADIVQCCPLGAI